MATTPYLAVRYPSDNDLAVNGNTQIQNLASDVDAFFGAETTWNPVVTQSGTLTMTNTRRHFQQVGRWVEFDLWLVYSSGTGTGGVKVTVSLPVVAKTTSIEIPVGFGLLFDSSASTRHIGVWVVDPANNANMILKLAGGTAGVATFTAAVTTSDEIKVSGRYEV